MKYVRRHHVGGLALFIALGGTSYAAVSAIPDAGGVLHGCVNTKSGVLRVVKNASSCHKTTVVKRGGKRVQVPGELAITWNQRGRTGPTGQTGQAGQTGKAGESAPPATPGPWHEVGAAGEPDFGKGWVNECTNTGVMEPCTSAAFYMDSSGFVHLKGNVRDPVVGGSSSIIFQLPPGYRTSKLARFHTWNNQDAQAYIEIYAGGFVRDKQTSVENGLEISLDGISFRPDS